VVFVCPLTKLAKNGFLLVLEFSLKWTEYSFD